MAEYTLNEICDRVTAIVLDSLDIADTANHSLSTNLINDLEAESLDFLDIVFRVEKAFGIKIERGKLENTIRKRLPELNVKPNSPVTDELRTVLEEMLPEVPAEEIQALQKIKDASRTFRIATFVRMSVEALMQSGSTVVAPAVVDGYSPAQLGLAA